MARSTVPRSFDPGFKKEGKTVPPLGWTPGAVVLSLLLIFCLGSSVKRYTNQNPKVSNDKGTHQCSLENDNSQENNMLKHCIVKGHALRLQVRVIALYCIGLQFITLLSHQFIIKFHYQFTMEFLNCLNTVHCH